MKRIFLLTTGSGSEYLVILTPAQKLPGSFVVLLLVQLAGGSRRFEEGLARNLPEIGHSFWAGFKGGRALRTSVVTNIREI